MGSSFHSNDVALEDVLKPIDNAEIQLPDFQRGWVWDDTRIKALIASITNSYPVGAVMFLEYGGDSVRFKYRPFTGVENGAVPSKLVLDGRERLTSVYCAMYSQKVRYLARYHQPGLFQSGSPDIASNQVECGL